MSFQKNFIGTQIGSFQEATTTLQFPIGAQFIKMEQIHENKIATINDAITDDPIKGVDACHTNKKNIFLSVKTADCLPILISGFDDKQLPFVAAAHAGRKGTESKILYLLLEKLNDTYNFVNALQNESEKQLRLNIWFGPAICEKCYQIDRATNLHYDLIAENKKQIVEFFAKNKLDPQKSLNLEVENHCTLHEPEKYYSYRATGPGVKMNYSFIGII